MAAAPGSRPLALPAAPGGAGGQDGPFGGPGLLGRVAPFAVVAVLAEASLALPAGGRTSLWPAVASIVVLLAMPAAFLLPWARFPSWMPVLFPLAFTGWVLALVLAERGAHVGLAPIAMVPALWAALFHRRWESACVVAAIAAVEVIDSLANMPPSASVIVRRALLWILLSGLISVAVQGLRDRIRRSQAEAARLQERLLELTVLEDRDRIAADLQDKVVEPVFAAGLAVHGAAAATPQPEIRRRLISLVEDLDQVLRVLRETIFGLEHRRRDRGMRGDVLALAGQLSPPPEVAFSGPVEAALTPETSAQLLELIRDGLTLIVQRFVPVRIGLTAGETSYVTVIDAVPRSRVARPHGGGAGDVTGAGFAALRQRAARSGITMDIDPGIERVRFAWHVTLDPSGTGAGGKLPMAAQAGASRDQRPWLR